MAAISLAWACGGGDGSSDDDQGATGGTRSDDDDNDSTTGGTDGKGGGDTSAIGGSGTGGSGATATGGSSAALLVNRSEQTVGDFTITVKAPSSDTAGSTTFSGRVRNEALLASDGYVWTLLEESGKCQLTQPQAPFCDPTCTGTTKCVRTNNCVEPPVEQDVGAVTVKGLKLSSGEDEFTVNIQSENKKIYQKTGIAYPPCAAGDKLGLSAEGKTYEAFSMETTCIDPLEMTVGDAVSLQKGKTTKLTWTAPDNPDTSKILIEIDISHHGGQTGQINCEVDDTGSFDLPEALTTHLIELGYAGFPDVSLTRVAWGSASMEPGRVDFSIVSTVDLPIDLGVTSCDKDDSDCADGELCNDTLMVCEIDCSDDADACPAGTRCTEHADTNADGEQTTIKLCDQVRSP
ncbi:MAG: hypothetical protein JW940_33670 [Polyangiaceae bacterium]|nr:hypothetical protein [Polyangiaceae bacterium]